jgi:hypothetical protein
MAYTMKRSQVDLAGRPLKTKVPFVEIIGLALKT